MRKSRLEYVIKARADYAMKTSVELLVSVLGFHDEADVVRRALSELIQRNHHLLQPISFAQAQQNGNG